MTVNNSMPERYKYHVVNRKGERVESNIPDERQAEIVINYLLEQNPHESYSVEQEQFYTVTGMGRDPDLH